MKKYIDLEEKILADYAMKSKLSRGREFDEPVHPYRTPFQRDKDRIIHSTAFRRLEYKTQVFVNHEGDHYRTRLTHTLEVAQISRALARALNVNEDLSEAIALAHDLGHTPFGHSGEVTMNELMKDHGGFEHNKQSLRVIEFLEHKYADFRGINPTYELREGLIKHETEYDKPAVSHLHPEENATIEAQIVNLADEIAYICHDADDGITSGILTDKMLSSNVELWREASNETKQRYPNLNWEKHKDVTVRGLINILVSSVYDESVKRIKENKIKTLEDVRNFDNQIVCYPSEMKLKTSVMKKFLYENMYYSTRVFRMAEKAKRILTDMFNTYTTEPRQLPETTQRKINHEGLDKYQVVCDYIAGMTDRYALQEYKRLFDPFEKV